MTAGAAAAPPAAETVDISPVVEASGVTKRFRGRPVLQEVDLAFRTGRVTALVGPNGAGKSTLLKMIVGLCRVDEGTLRVLGRSAGLATLGGEVGYMPQIARFPENLTGREVLRMLTDLRGEDLREEPDPDLLERFRLIGELEKPVRTLSGGTRQKLSAAIAFRFRPRLLVLDEPSAGLDPRSNAHLKDRIRAAREAGTSVVVASHVMSELEQVADDVAILLEGRVRYQGTVRRLTERAGVGAGSLERAIASLMDEAGA